MALLSFFKIKTKIIYQSTPLYLCYVILLTINIDSTHWYNMQEL